MKITDEPFDLELIYDLHRLVAIDAVTEYYKIIEKECPDRMDEYMRLLREYYDTRYWEKHDNI
jgi:hypothetical protein